MLGGVCLFFFFFFSGRLKDRRPRRGGAPTVVGWGAACTPCSWVWLCTVWWRRLLVPRHGGVPAACAAAGAGGWPRGGQPPTVAGCGWRWGPWRARVARWGWPAGVRCGRRPRLCKCVVGGAGGAKRKKCMLSAERCAALMYCVWVLIVAAPCLQGRQPAQCLCAAAVCGTSLPVRPRLSVGDPLGASYVCPTRDEACVVLRL